MLTVVTGPPAAGKSTWVEARAKPEDIVVDYDRLASALSGPGGDPHDRAPAVKRATWAAREAAIRSALKQANAANVYVIHTSPSAERMAEYAAAGAKIVTIDPGQDVIRQRVSSERPIEMAAVAEDWYRTDRQVEAVQITALDVVRITEGHPHSGQRFTHGWIPVGIAGHLDKATAALEHHFGEGKVQVDTDWKGAHFTIDTKRGPVHFTVSTLDVAAFGLSLAGGPIGAAADVALIAGRLNRARRLARAARVARTAEFAAGAAGTVTHAARESTALAVVRLAEAAGHDVTPGHDNLHHWWTRGPGLKLWIESDHQFTTLVAQLVEHAKIPEAKAKTWASAWVHEVTGNWPGSDAHRVAQGHPPRGHNVGPG